MATKADGRWVRRPWFAVGLLAGLWACGGQAGAAWWETTTLATDQVGTHLTMAFDADAHLVIACRDDAKGDLLCWHDANGNLSNDAGEMQVIDADGDVGRYASLAFADGKAVVAYYDGTKADLKIWYDADGDFAADAGEVRTIDGAGTVGRFASLAIAPGAKAAAAYHADGTGDLKLWYDADGDFAADAGEIRVIQSAGTVGQYTSIVIDDAGLAAVAYYDVAHGDLLCWYDADGDFAFTAGEIQTIDGAGNVGRFTSAGLTAGGSVIVAYYDDDGGNLKLWHDANGNFAADTGEVRLIDATGNRGQYTSLALDASGRTLVSFRDVTNGDTRVWYDLNGDLAAVEGEREAVEDSVNAGFFTRVVFCPTDGRIIAVFYDVASQALRMAVTLYGDVNLDGSVDTVDVAAFVEIVLSPGGADPEMLAASDLNWDGACDGADAALLCREVLGG